MVADLIGPDVKFHHCKINLKLPGTNTEVGYHQDFAYTPHTNDDIVTALIFVDEVTADNGALMVVPGSHRGPIYSPVRGRPLHRLDRAGDRGQAQGAAGAGHRPGGQRLPDAHAALPRLRGQPQQRPRGLYICVYTAADAFPLARNPMANPNEGKDRARQGDPFRAA